MPGKYVLDDAPYRLKVELVKAGIYVVQQFSIWAVWETTPKIALKKHTNGGNQIKNLPQNCPKQKFLLSVFKMRIAGVD